MVKIGNIVDFGKGKINLDHFNVFKDISDVDNDLPTLLVGYSNIRPIYGELNFFNKKIEDNLFWTFNKIEDRYNYNKDLGSFIEYCEENLTNGFEYLFINPFELKLSQIKRFIKFLKGNTGFVLLDGSMVFIWASDRTYGFHMEFSELFGIEKEHILRFLSENNYKLLSEKEVVDAQNKMGEVDYDLSELLFLKEKFAI